MLMGGPKKSLSRLLEVSVGFPSYRGVSLLLHFEYLVIDRLLVEAFVMASAQNPDHKSKRHLRSHLKESNGPRDGPLPIPAEIPFNPEAIDAWVYLPINDPLIANDLAVEVPTARPMVDPIGTSTFTPANEECLIDLAESPRDLRRSLATHIIRTSCSCANGMWRRS